MSVPIYMRITNGPMASSVSHNWESRQVDSGATHKILVNRRLLQAPLRTETRDWEHERFLIQHNNRPVRLFGVFILSKAAMYLTVFRKSPSCQDKKKKMFKNKQTKIQ